MSFKLPALAAIAAIVALSIVPQHASAQAKRHKVGVSFYSQTIPLYVEMQQGMMAEAAKRNIDLEFQYS